MCDVFVRIVAPCHPLQQCKGDLVRQRSMVQTRRDEAQHYLWQLGCLE